MLGEWGNQGEGMQSHIGAYAHVFTFTNRVHRQFFFVA